MPSSSSKRRSPRKQQQINATMEEEDNGKSVPKEVSTTASDRASVAAAAASAQNNNNNKTTTSTSTTDKGTLSKRKRSRSQEEDGNGDTSNGPGQSSDNNNNHNNSSSSKKKKPPPGDSDDELQYEMPPAKSVATADDRSKDDDQDDDAVAISTLPDFEPSMEAALGVPLDVVFRRVGGSGGGVSGLDGTMGDGGSPGSSSSSGSALTGKVARAGSGKKKGKDDTSPLSGASSSATTPQQDNTACKSHASPSTTTTTTTDSPPRPLGPLLLNKAEALAFLKIRMLGQELDVILGWIAHVHDRRRRVRQFRSVLLQRYCGGWGESSTHHNPFLAALIPVLSTVLLEERGPSAAAAAQKEEDDDADKDNAEEEEDESQPTTSTSQIHSQDLPTSLKRLHWSLTNVTWKLRKFSAQLKHYADQNWSLVDSLVQVMEFQEQMMQTIHSAPESGSSNALNGPRLLALEKQRLAELEQEVASRIDTLLHLSPQSSTADEESPRQSTPQSLDLEAETQSQESVAEDDAMDVEKPDEDGDSVKEENERSCSKQLFPPSQDTNASDSDAERATVEDLYMPLKAFCARLFSNPAPAVVTAASSSSNRKESQSSQGSHKSTRKHGPTEEEHHEEDSSPKTNRPQDPSPSPSPPPRPPPPLYQDESTANGGNDADLPGTMDDDANTTLTPSQTQTTYSQDAGNTPSRRARLSTMGGGDDGGTPRWSQNSMRSSVASSHGTDDMPLYMLRTQKTPSQTQDGTPAAGKRDVENERDSQNTAHTSTTTTGSQLRLRSQPPSQPSQSNNAKRSAREMDDIEDDDDEEEGGGQRVYTDNTQAGANAMLFMYQGGR